MGEHDAGGDGNLGDERVGHALRDGLELERARQLRGELLDAAQTHELLAHAPVQQAVLHGKRDAVGDRLELLLLGALEGLGGTAGEEEEPEGLVADEQPDPRDVQRAVALEPLRDRRHLVDGAGVHRGQGGEALEPGDREASLRDVRAAHTPLGLDLQGGVGPEGEHGDVGREELGHLDGRALDDGVEVDVVPEDRDDLAQARRPGERLRGVALGRLEPLEQLRVLVLQLLVGRRHQSARIATLELWMPAEPVTRANSPQV